MLTASTQQTEFTVSYEGLAFANYTMEVRDLAPALLALGQAFDRANVLLNGDRANISLSIRATRPSSFEISLLLQQLLTGATDILSGDLFTSAANLTELILGGPLVGVGLFKLLKGLSGKKPHISEPTPQGILFEADHIRIFVPTEVARLYGDRPLRDQIEAFVRPLSKEGVDRLVFRRGQVDLESITHTEAPYFHAEEGDPNITEYIIPRQRLQIASLTFNREGKWRLSDGANTRWYSMEDADFVKAIQEGERFGREDILICEVLLTQRLEGDGKLRMEYSVRKVSRHIVPGEQMRLVP